MNDKNNEPVEIDEVKLQQTIARVVGGEGSEEDKSFIKELEKLIGKPIIGGKLQMLGEKIKANKVAMAAHELEAKTKLTEIELEKQRRLSELDKQYQLKLKELDSFKFEVERKARSREIKKKLVFGLLALIVIAFAAEIFGVKGGLLTFGLFAVLFYAFKN